MVSNLLVDLYPVDLYIWPFFFSFFFCPSLFFLLPNEKSGLQWWTSSRGRATTECDKRSLPCFSCCCECNQVLSIPWLMPLYKVGLWFLLLICFALRHDIFTCQMKLGFVTNIYIYNQTFKKLQCLCLSQSGFYKQFRFPADFLELFRVCKVYRIRHSGWCEQFRARVILISSFFCRHCVCVPVCVSACMPTKDIVVAWFFTPVNRTLNEEKPMFINYVPNIYYNYFELHTVLISSWVCNIHTDLETI